MQKKKLKKSITHAFSSSLSCCFFLEKHIHKTETEGKGRGEGGGGGGERGGNININPNSAST
jgi:hypothetical protein